MYLISVIIGLILGYCYWLSLLGLTKRASSYTVLSISNKFVIFTATQSFFRLIIFAGIFYYLLRQINVHPILVILAFLSSLWALLLLKKD